MHMRIRSDWRPGRVIAATLLTVLFPGAGHLVLRRWRAAALWSGGFVVTALAGWQMLGIDTVGDLFDPSVIRRGLAVSALVAVLRVGALVDVLWITNSFAAATTATFGALVMLITLLPHLIVQVQGQHTAAALETVFGPPTVTTTTTTRPVSPAAPATTDPTVEQDDDDFSVYASPATLTTLSEEEEMLAAVRSRVTAEPIPFSEQRQQLALGEDGRFTVILLGSDEGPSRGGARTDTMIVVTIDPWTLRTSMFSIPRNWAQVPMPPEWPGPETHNGISNTIYRYGWANAETLFPDAADPGAEALKRVYGDLLALEIDHFWMTTMSGFVDVVDAFGGVTIDVQLPIDNEFSHPDGRGQWYYVKLRTGMQTLDGLEALAYARSRRTTSDYNRMARQRCVVAALGRQITASDLLFAFDDLVTAFEDHVSTDISLSTLPALVDVATLIRLDTIETVTFVPPTFVDGTDSRGRWVPHVERVRQAVRDSLTQDAASSDLVETVDVTC